MRSPSSTVNNVRMVLGMIAGQWEAIRMREVLRPSFRGVCFTYATMFALESLAIAGENHANSEAVRRACQFIVGHQAADGGWGETYMVRLWTMLAVRTELS